MIDFELLNKSVKLGDATVMLNHSRVGDIALYELPKNFTATMELNSNGVANITIKNLDNKDDLLVFPSTAKCNNDEMILKIFNLNGVDAEFLNKLKLLKKNRFFKKEKCPASFAYHHLDCDDFKDSYFFNGVGIYDTFKDLQEAVSTLDNFYQAKAYKKEDDEVKIEL